MFQKIFDALKAKHSNIPKSVLERVAKILSKTCTEEDKISDAVDGANEMVTEIADLVQKEGDRRATEASKKNPGQQQNPTQDTPKSEPNTEDMPAWAKALIESNKQVTEKLSSLEAEKTSQNFSEKAIGFAKEKGIPEKFAKTLLKAKGLIKSEEEYTEFTSLLENDFKEIQPEFTPEGTPPPPVFGTSSKSGVSAMVENFVKEDDKSDPFAGKKI